MSLSLIWGLFLDLWDILNNSGAYVGLVKVMMKCPSPCYDFSDSEAPLAVNFLTKRAGAAFHCCLRRVPRLAFSEIPCTVCISSSILKARTPALCLSLSIQGWCQLQWVALF